MNAEPRLSVIFVNYQSAGLLSAALESLFSQEQKSDFFEIIVVNNDVTESQELEKLRQSFPFLLLESGGNVGFGSASNKGAAASQGDILGFINPDTLWREDCLQRIAVFLDGHRTIGILGMTLLDPDGHPEPWSQGQAPTFARLLLNNLSPRHPEKENTEEVVYTDWVSGGAFFTRKEIFAAAGGFDERFFLYFEDVDLCAEVRGLGFSVARHPSFTLIHLRGGSQSSYLTQKKTFYISQRKYFKKRRPRWENILLSFAQFFFLRIH